MPPHDNRHSRRTEKAKDRKAAEAKLSQRKPLEELRRLIYMQQIFESFKTGRLPSDSLAIILANDTETTFTLKNATVIELEYTEETIVQPGQHHYCVYIDHFVPGVPRTRVRVLFPLVSYKTELNRVGAQLRGASKKS